MNKDERIAYFKTIYGRSPSDEEIDKALKAGEFFEATYSDTHALSQKQWSQYFRKIHHRKPSQSEVKDAVASGEAYVKSASKKKWWLYLAPIVMAGLLILGYYVIIYRNTNSVAKIRTSNNSNVKNALGTKSDYAEVLSAYYDSVDKQEVTDADIETVNPEIIYTADASLLNTFYALYDFNNDGINELIIAVGTGDDEVTEYKMSWSRNPYALWTLNKERKPIQLNFGTGYRTCLLPLEGGELLVSGSNSYNSGSYSVYTIEGTELVSQEELIYDNSTYKIDNQIVTKNDYYAEVDNFDVLDADDLAWDSLQQYKIRRL